MVASRNTSWPTPTMSATSRTGWSSVRLRRADGLQGPEGNRSPSGRVGVVISGIGGLGHTAVQYAKAMGLCVAAIDIAEDKLKLAKELGADLTANAASTNPVDAVQSATGAAHGVLVTAVSPKAFSHAIGMVRRRGTVSLVGLPPGGFPAPIFDIVLKRITVRGSIVGPRKDLSEALAVAGEEGHLALQLGAARADQRRVRLHAQGHDRRPGGAGPPLSRPMPLRATQCPEAAATVNGCDRSRFTLAAAESSPWWDVRR